MQCKVFCIVGVAPLATSLNPIFFIPQYSPAVLKLQPLFLLPALGAIMGNVTPSR